MSLAIFIKIIIFLFPLAYSPGPGNIFFAINGARFGFNRTIGANVGYHLATWIVTFAIGIVFLKGIAGRAEYFAPLKYLGSAYVMFLAWKIFRAGAIDRIDEPKPAGFIDGVLLLLLNPKAYVIIFLLFTQFLSGGEGEGYRYVADIATIFTLNNLLAFILWTVAGDVLLKNFRDTGNARLMNRVFGGVLFLVGLWILLT